MTCRAEFRLLKDQYPPYADRVNFLAVGVDPNEGADVLRRYHLQQGYPWAAALGNRQFLETYRVISTDIKYALDSQGIIRFQKGYGASPPEVWAELLRSLAAS